MDTLKRLSLRYKTPAALGVRTADELAGLLADVVGSTTSHDAALIVLLETETSLLRQKVETLKAASGAQIDQGLATRLASLERELRELRGRQAGGSGTGFRVVSGGVTWVPRGRTCSTR